MIKACDKCGTPLMRDGECVYGMAHEDKSPIDVLRLHQILSPLKAPAGTEILKVVEYAVRVTLAAKNVECHSDVWLPQGFLDALKSKWR